MEFGDPKILASMRKLRRKAKTTVARGYYAPPGSGPDGETCGTCFYCSGHGRGLKRWHKCDLARERWTGGRGTDVLVGSPACHAWEMRP